MTETTRTLSDPVWEGLIVRWDNEQSLTSNPVEWVRQKTGEHLWSQQRAILASIQANRYTVVHSAHELGKMLRLDEPLPTPTGWVCNGDVQVGDELLDEQGRTCRVTALGQIEPRPSYRITFDDATSMDCGDNHQWSVLDLRRRVRGAKDHRQHWDRAVTVTTQQLVDLGLRISIGQLRWRIPVTKPLDLPVADLPIDPYVLGVWLGDGHTDHAMLTIHPDDNYITDRCAETENVRRLECGAYLWTLAGEHPRGRLKIRLRALGVLGSKHIPASYARASLPQRLDLMRGIMDTDGTITPDSGYCSIDLCDERLARDVMHLGCTLGWKMRMRKAPAVLNGVEVGTRYRIQFRPDFQPFALPRKAARWREPGLQSSGATQRTIVSIEPIEPSPMRCLTVDSPRSLFLAGPALVPTHNSKVAALAIAQWIDSHPVGEAFVVSTAPSAAQVSSILWREIAKTHSKANLSGRINRAGYPQWFMGAELVGYGRKPADYEQSAFQGIHARYVLVVIDEAGGVPQTLYNAIDSIVGNDHSRVLAIGNPDDPGSHFASICKPDSIWNVIHLDGLRSPNMTKERVVGYRADGFGNAHPRYPLTKALMEAEGIDYATEEIPFMLRELLMGPLWVEECIRSWAGFGATAHLDYLPDELGQIVRSRCEASALFSAKVRGVFPSSTATGVIPLGWVEQAHARWQDFVDSGRDLSRVPHPSACVVGVDVAYGGQDETVISTRWGHFSDTLHRYRHADTVETADAASAYLHETGSYAVVDVIGIGAGVYDTLRRYRREARIAATPVPFNASAATPRTDIIGQFRFRNDRAAAWWKMRELLDPSRGSRLMLPPDERLTTELTSVKYKMLAGGVIQIESKDEIRKRLGRSTDSADAVIQSYWIEGSDIGALVGIAYQQSRHPGDGVLDYAGYSVFTPDDLNAAPGMDAGLGSQRTFGGERVPTVYRPNAPDNDFGDWDL